MKKPILLAFLAIGLAFTSCNKDDDDSSGPNCRELGNCNLLFIMVNQIP